MYNKGADYGPMATCWRTFVSRYTQKSISNMRDSKRKLIVL
jgi:hypothetical protein